MQTSVKSPLEMFYHWEKTTPHKVFLRQAKNLQWSEYTWEQAGIAARKAAAYIQSFNYPSGSRIAIWSANSKDWIIADLAIMLSGHISVPLYPSQDVDSARYVLAHSEAKMIFLGAFDEMQKVDSVVDAGITRVGMLGFKGASNTTMEIIEAMQKPLMDSPVPDPQAVFTFIYTSGTTGNPKGAMHKYETPGWVVPDLVENFGLEQGNTRYFSFLPLAHAAERIMVDMSALYTNGEISFSEGLETFAQEIASVQPDFFFAVPRLWIKFKDAISNKIAPATVKDLPEQAKAGIVKQLGLSNAKYVLVGSAPCPTDVQLWFLELGILLREGYGMTENFIHGCSWGDRQRVPVPGCVGKPMGRDIQVKIDPQTQEIAFKSKGLMLGYYKEPEKTAQALKDGWYYTGDKGRFDENGDLWITGRLGDVFKTTKGKYIDPVSLEDLFGGDPLLAQFCVFGHGLDNPVLLATLSEAGKKMSREEIKQRLQALLDRVNAKLPSNEQTPQIFITKTEWLSANGLLTATLKLKRKSLEAHYRQWVESHLGKEHVIFEDA